MAKTLQELTDEAMELRKKFEKIEKEACGREWTNVELAAAFTADVGQLSKLIMLKEGLRKDKQVTDQQLEHELADCLWCILVFAKKYDVDLEKALTQMMENE
ncbi:MAG: MazG nucleotide pyrophosphohydrolase [candidate division TM6 bacterium GW2011_GWF2_37_49]|nr:MAG: MazG nucleotide pyrophosphohydrolase [candidate division TM6 bacterium GW2011_GWF2_37_49]